MADDNKLSGKVGLDTTDFKTNTAALNRELRVVESGFRASAAALGDWASDASGLELRIKTLNSSLDIQKQKVAATRAEYERITAEKGETSRAAQDLEIKLNRETETLNKMENELGNTESALEEMRSGSDDAGEEVEELGEKSEETGGKLEGLKSVLGGVGAVAKATVTVVLGLVAAVAAVTVAIGALVFSTASASAELVDLAAKTGISTTALQEWSYVGDQVGTSSDTITGSLARMIRTVGSAVEQQEDFNRKQAEAVAQGQKFTGELGAAADAYRKLGVDLTGANGQLRDSEAIFQDVIAALGRIPNETERDALAMEIFGKSAMELNPLIKAGSDELERLAREAHEVGAVMSEEDVAAFEAFDDTLASLQAGLKGTLGTLSAAFLPGFQAVFDQVGGYLKTFTDIVRGADGDFGQIAEGLTGLVTDIATDMAQQAPQMLQAGLGIVRSILDAILAALPELLNAGIEILTALIGFIVQALPQLIQAGVQILLMLVNVIVANLPMLIEAALLAVIALANGLADALPTLIPAIVEAVVLIVKTLVKNIPLLIDAALKLILGLADGLIAALPVLLPAIPEIVRAILDALIESLPILLPATVELILTLAGGILENLPLLLQAVVQVIEAIFRAFIEADWGKIGRTLIEGIREGWNEHWQSLVDNIIANFNALLGYIKDLLGIASPSQWGLSIGKNLVESIGLGGLQGLDAAQRSLATAMKGLQLAPPAPAGVNAGGSVSTQNEQFQFFAPVVIRGDTPTGSLGARLKGRRY